MEISKDFLTDNEIGILIQQNNTLGWEYLFDKYAPIMYGAILRIVRNESLAEKILCQLFIKLKKEKDYFKGKKSLCLSLILDARLMASLYGGNPNAITDNKISWRFPVLDSLLYKQQSVKEIAEHLFKSVGEVRQMLALEIDQMQKNIPTEIQGRRMNFPSYACVSNYL